MLSKLCFTIYLIKGMLRIGSWHLKRIRIYIVKEILFVVFTFTQGGHLRCYLIHDYCHNGFFIFLKVLRFNNHRCPLLLRNDAYVLVALCLWNDSRVLVNILLLLLVHHQVTFGVGSLVACYAFRNQPFPFSLLTFNKVFLNVQ